MANRNSTIKHEAQWIVCIWWRNRDGNTIRMPNTYLCSRLSQHRVSTDLDAAEGHRYQRDAKVAADATGVVYTIHRRRDFRASQA